MDLESIYALMERFERSSLTGLELEQNGTRLKLDKTVAVAAAPAAAVAAVSAVQTPAAVAAVSAVQTPAAPAPQSEAQNGTQDEGEYIKAPLVGTFYAAAGPDAEPFVKVGDQVKKGQTVCILEAMKMMSEIPAPMDCVIEEILVENGSLAGYDAPLFRVRRV